MQVMLALVDNTVEDGALGWQERALCAQTDPEAFFPEKGGSTREAKKVCQTCEVRAECLEYALAHDERFGIWGGLSEDERINAQQIVARIHSRNPPQRGAAIRLAVKPEEVHVFSNKTGDRLS